MIISTHKMRDFCEITSSKRIFASEYVDSGVPFYRSKEVIERQTGKLNISTEIFIKESRFDEIERKFGAPEHGDLLLTSVGTLGVPYVVSKDERFYFKDGNLTWFRKFKGLNSRYLYYWFLSPIGKAQLQKATIGSSQSAYTINLLNELSITPQELKVQLRIVECLSAYDDLIAINQRRIALLEDAARRLYREWFVHLRFPGHESVPVQDGVPQGWQKGTAHDFISVLSGGTPKTGAEHYWGGEIPFFTPKDSPDVFYVIETEKTLTETGLSNCNSRLFVKNTTFITARGTVGKVALAQKPMAMNQSCYALVPKQVYNKFFLFTAIKDVVEHFKQVAVGGVFDAIVVDTFKIIPFVLPEIALTEAFGDKVDPMFHQIEALLLQNQQLTNARDLLLPKLMSGQLDVSHIPLPQAAAH